MAKTSFSVPQPQPLLAWYGRFKRDLPWRSHNGRAPSPYHTWLSEIMLQQTTVATVIPYYIRFTTRWPTVEALAQAHEDDVLKEWAGLGYYSRARNLLACARTVVADHDGIFPSDIATLKTLPGIGEYTANAIRAIAFDLPASVMDGNVERVLTRIFAIEDPINLPVNKSHLRVIASHLAPDTQCGDYAQALMELGATVCTPKNPRCTQCPWQNVCKAFSLGKTASIPVIQRKTKTPHRHAIALVIRDKTGRFLLRQRPSKGLLGGLWEPFGTAWTDEAAQFPASLQNKIEDFIRQTPDVVHVFSHFKLTTIVYRADASFDAEQALADGLIDGTWFSPDDLPALSRLSEKIIERAIQGEDAL